MALKFVKKENPFNYPPPNRNHYLFVHPVDKIYILFEDPEGETHVLRVELPTWQSDDGFVDYDLDKTPEVHQHEVLELSKACELTSEGDDLLSAYAQYNEHRHGNDSKTPFIAVPLSFLTGTIDALRKKRQQQSRRPAAYDERIDEQTILMPLLVAHSETP